MLHNTSPIWMTVHLVSFHVTLQISTATECCITHLTLEWTFTSVSSHVILQIATLIECCITHITLEWSYTSVSSHVISQIFISRKCCITHFTFKWPIVSVRTYVSIEIFTLIESYITHVTFERSFSRVYGYASLVVYCHWMLLHIPHTWTVVRQIAYICDSSDWRICFFSIRICFFSSLLSQNVASHTAHLKGRSPVWIRMRHNRSIVSKVYLH